MKDELIALANRLNEMAFNTGTLNCLGCGYEHGCGLHGCAVLKRAADIIRCVSLNVMDDIKLALLGNQEAARRLTDSGILLPCPGCGGEHNRCWWQFGGAMGRVR